ncbi:MAG: exo-alpha-sialidase [Opitutus sp.]|nr:exo-alpha-sialidase [Opitutus sp.]
MNSAVSRRHFLRTVATAAPLPFLLASGTGAETRPATTYREKPLQPGFAFRLIPVAEADEKKVRKSEASLVELRDGTVLLAYASHAGRSDNDRAPLVARRLSAEGLPLTDERVIVPPPEGGFNAMSPALQRLPDGRIGMLFSYRQSQKEASRRFVVSSDEGETWSNPVIVADGQYKTGCHDRFTVHSSGRLLAPCHCTEDWDKHHLHVRVGRSDDLGATWQLGEPIELPYVRWFKPGGDGFVQDTESGCIEPGIAERADGSLIMAIRTAMGTQFKSESFDRGATWSTPTSMEVVSPVAPAHISRIPGTSDLLLLWTSDYDAKARLSGERHTIMTCISSDGGRSWPHERRKVLAHDPSQSLDYPSLLYKGTEAWITLRRSTGKGVLAGFTSTSLMRVPLAWFRTT